MYMPKGKGKHKRRTNNTAATHLTDDDLNYVSGGVAGGIPDTTDPGDDLAKILHVVGEDRDDLHADTKPGSVDQRSDKIHRQ